MKDRRQTNGVKTTRITLAQFVECEPFQQGLRDLNQDIGFTEHYSHVKDQIMYEKGRQLGALLRSKGIHSSKYFQSSKIVHRNRAELISYLDYCNFRKF